MKITKNQNEALNDFQDSRGYVPFIGEDGFVWNNDGSINIVDQEEFISTLECIIDICQDSIIDECDVKKKRKWLSDIMKLHNEIA